MDCLSTTESTEIKETNKIHSHTHPNRHRHRRLCKLQHLDVDCLRHVLRFCDSRSAIRLACLFRAAKDACYDDLLWRGYVLKDFPDEFEETTMKIRQARSTENTQTQNDTTTCSKITSACPFTDIELPEWMMQYRQLVYMHCKICSEKLPRESWYIFWRAGDSLVCCDRCLDEIERFERMYDA